MVFSLIIDLSTFDLDDFAGVRFTVTPSPQMLPSPSADTTYGTVEPPEKVTDAQGVAQFELVSAPGLQYVVESRATGRRVISGDWPDGHQLRFEDAVSVVPSPILPVDAGSILAQVDVRIQAALDGATELEHLHTSAQVTDFVEAAQDAVAAMLAAGSNVTLTYDDAANTLSVSAAGGGAGGLDAEAVRDAVGVALVGVGNVSVSVNDAADTITITTAATVNATDAALRDRSTHTGTQPIESVAGLPAALAAKAESDHTHAGMVTSTTVTSIVSLTQAAYDLLPSPESDPVLYLIEEA